MKKLEDVLWLIKKNPNQYIGKKCLGELYCFIHGYIKCQYTIDGTYPEWTSDFMAYMQIKYDVKMSIDVPTILRQVSLTDEDAFDKFYELLEDFFAVGRDENL